MFETQDSQPWYRSTRTQILAAVLVLVVGAGSVVLFISWRRGNEKEAHYAALEQHRAQQAASGNDQAAGAPVASQPSASPAAQAPGAQPPTISETATAHASRNYWTNFRGPNRDGLYNEMPVSTTWPAQGLPLLWKAPVGLGFASFAVADGRAYTIEQRRQKEVVAAYDVNTGRELWIQGWNAEYKV